MSYSYYSYIGKIPTKTLLRVQQNQIGTPRFEQAIAFVSNDAIPSVKETAPEAALPFPQRRVE